MFQWIWGTFTCSTNISCCRGTRNPNVLQNCEEYLFICSYIYKALSLEVRRNEVLPVAYKLAQSAVNNLMHKLENVSVWILWKVESRYMFGAHFHKKYIGKSSFCEGVFRVNFLWNGRLKSISWKIRRYPVSQFIISLVPPLTLISVKRSGTNGWINLSKDYADKWTLSSLF
jgi:hypothetical protein